MLAYCRTFSVPALFDDDASIADNPTIHHLRTALIPPSYATVGGRPVLNVSFAVNYAISGNRVWSYHAINLAIHVLAGLFLFGIARRTLLRRSMRAALPAAFSIALLWALHPLQTESVTYIVQRAESLMGLFYLSTLYFFIRGAENQRPTGSGWFVLSIVSCFLGMATKEVMVSAPLIVFLYDRTFVAGSFSGAWRERRRIYAGLAATWIILPLLVLSTHGRGGTAGFGSGVSVWSYALTEFRAITHYLTLSVWPRPLIFDYGTALAPHTVAVLPDALLVAALVALTLWALVKRPVFGFLGAWFLAILAPTSSIVPVASEPMAEHRMYLAIVPILVLVVAGIYRWLGSAALPATLVLATALCAATFARNTTYESDELIWSDTVKKLPANERALNNLGHDLDEEGRTAEAIAQFEQVLRLKPDLAEAHSNLGSALSKIPGHLDEAIAQYRECIRLKPGYVTAHINLANALDDKGLTQDSIEQSEEAIRLNPDLAEAHSSLASALSKTPGRLDEAVSEGEKAIELKPEGAKARLNFGNILVRVPGRLDDAIAQFEEAVRLSPGIAEAHVNLGNALDAKGRVGEAIAQFQAALRIRPDSAEAHSNLGNALAKVPGRMDEAIGQYQQALALKPSYVSAHNNLGSVLNAEGRTSEAVDQYEQALRLNPDIPAIQLNLAIALLKLPGRSSEAVAHLEKALSLDPGNATARRLLSEISSR
jgi:tetratricopeptide (TPR) repeat protein